MAENNRGFKGIWIPRQIWLNKELSSKDKVLLAEINSLDNEEGCIASNAYFAEFFQMSKGNVSKSISKLKSLGYIDVHLIYKTSKEVDKRVIKVINKDYKPKPIKTHQPDNQLTVSVVANMVEAEAVLITLNDVCKKKYRKSKSSLRPIIARLNEGYSVQELEAVIKIKSKQWLKDLSMNKYLRPETLFGATKFPSYLEESRLTKVRDVDSGQFEDVRRNFYKTL
jgi:uncharacterized phage protein (TIGR02220 family)